MEQKIYISLKEAESLVFNKIIILPETRLGIERAQKDWSIAVYIKNETFTEYANQIVLVAGAVLKFEIPLKEENLFLNHFRVPKGLLVLADRKYRESKDADEGFNFPDELDYANEIKSFKFIRRGLIKCFDLAVNNSISKEFSSEVYKNINNLTFSEFNLSLIKEILLNDFYPIKERNDGNFYAESVKRFNWFGAYIFNEFPEIKKLNENDLNEARQWFLNFKDKENSKSIQNAISNVPDIFFEEFEFIVGYYIAASFYEEANIGDDFYNILIEQLKKIKLDNNNKVLYWSIFFQALFKDDLDFLYVIASYQKQQLILENKLLQLLFSEIESSNSTFEIVELQKRQALAEYLQLQDGGELIEPTFITEEDEIELLKNNFSNQNMLNIGIEAATNSSLNLLFHNKCATNSLGFSLNLKSKPSKVTFYINDKSEVKDWLKELKIKTKPISKLIDNNKKALVGFLLPESYERSLLKVYEWILQNANKSTSIKTIVIVLLVDEEVEYIQSPEFQNKKIEMEKFLKSKFGENTSVLVKNERIKSDGEIKRNLKHLLEQYSIKDIELVNENIDDKIRNWIISVNNEFVVDSDIKNYYTFLNK
ncbi:hypothetical protein [Aequorivita sinensis]|uniref:hypothetical protein n=1 Tax=Aequorivita sinensis TaxID=1382458 RepID=UPI0023019A7C|nr:hypothetical protein [Aequorivita sinensis]